MEGKHLAAPSRRGIPTLIGIVASVATAGRYYPRISTVRDRRQTVERIDRAFHACCMDDPSVMLRTAFAEWWETVRPWPLPLPVHPSFDTVRIALSHVMDAPFPHAEQHTVPGCCLVRATFGICGRDHLYLSLGIVPPGGVWMPGVGEHVLAVADAYAWLGTVQEFEACRYVEPFPRGGDATWHASGTAPIEAFGVMRGAVQALIALGSPPA
jgi:hypothetical protein